MYGRQEKLQTIRERRRRRSRFKWSYEPSSGEQVPLALSRAIHIADAPARGPVYLSIPYGDWDKPAPANTANLSRRHVQQAGVPSEGQLKDLCVTTYNKSSVSRGALRSQTQMKPLGLLAMIGILLRAADSATRCGCALFPHGSGRASRYLRS